MKAEGTFVPKEKKQREKRKTEEGNFSCFPEHFSTAHCSIYLSYLSLLLITDCKVAIISSVKTILSFYGGYDDDVCN